MSKITMLHGAGGTTMHNFIDEYIIKIFGNIKNAEVPLEAADDAAVVDGIVLKSDSHVVKPIFFPGGDIGRLAISGTVNDIATLGAKPFALTCGLVLEEGLELANLKRIMYSMKKTCREAKTNIVTGDTKVVERGKLGGCIINTSGFGKRTTSLEKNLNYVNNIKHKRDIKWILDSNLKKGDKIILSGTIAIHGLAVLSAQEGINFGSNIKSDVKPLNLLIQDLLGEIGGIVTMKDPTRGGVADALNEFSEKSQTGILIQEDKIPIREDVSIACDMLGLDPLEIGNEGKVLIGVVAEKATEVKNFLRSKKDGKEAEIIGEATNDFIGVAMQTVVGGKRIISRPIGDPIPRIC